MEMLKRTKEWLRNLLAVAGLLAIGFWLGNASSVKAANGGDVQFQLTGVNETSSLLVYQPSSKTVYVYRGATVGNANLQCSFKYVMNSPGEAIQRVNCPPGSAFPR